MSQGQPQKPHDDQRSHPEAIKYGDVFDVSGSLASKPVAPGDASTMQTAENISEEVGDEVVGRYVTPDVPTRTPAAALNRDAITIGEALEATALSAGDKPIDQSDAAAIQAAEVRATGTNEIVPGGVASVAQSAADINPRIMIEEAKTKVADVLTNATALLPGDKPVTREDAEGVISAEIRNKSDMTTTPGGVAVSMAAAARLNQNT